MKQTVSRFSFLKAAIAASAVMGFVVATVPADAKPVALVHSSHVAGGVGFPAVVIGVASVLVLYDIVRRTTCSGDFLGLGGPGFSEPIRINQSVLPPPANCLRR